MEHNLSQRTCALRLCRAQHHYNCAVEARVPTQARLGSACFLQVDRTWLLTGCHRSSVTQTRLWMACHTTSRLPEWPLPLEHL